MILHVDSDHPKPIEQKVRDLILKKLYVKVDDNQIFIDKEIFIAMILMDVIAIAKADYDLDKALKIALKEQPHYAKMPDVKRNELSEAAVEFEMEVEAYKYFLDLKKDKTDELEIYDAVLMTLNSDEELLTKRLHELLMESLGSRLSEQDALSIGIDRWSLVDNFSRYVKYLASNDTIDEAAEEMQLDMEQDPEMFLIKEEAVKRELTRFAPLAGDQIGAYKIALSMQAQNMEIPMILAMVRQLLKLDQA